MEAELLAELSNAQRRGDTTKMKEIVTLMSNFRGYTACVDQFIVNAQKKSFIHPDIFQDVMPLARKVSAVVQMVIAILISIIIIYKIFHQIIFVILPRYSHIQNA